MAEYIPSGHDPKNIKEIEKIIGNLKKLLGKEGLMLMAGTGLAIIESRAYMNMQNTGNRIPQEAVILADDTFPCDGGDPW